MSSIFETVINIRDAYRDIKFDIPEDSLDKLNYLNGKTMNFETSKSDYSEWIIENLSSNNKIIDSIEEVK